MTTVVLSPSNVADYPEGGGHFWVYMQYVQGLRALGCEVYWMEHFLGTEDEQQDKQSLQIFIERMRQFGFAEKVMIYRSTQSPLFFDAIHGTTIGGKKAEKICQQADLLLNFSYAINPDLLSHFKRSALVDIDPGLLQFWISKGQLDVPVHDLYFSTGETVGKPNSLIPDCGIAWNSIRPVISLPDWPVVSGPESEVLTTISGWWGDEWITDGKDICYENNKRVTFMQFAELSKLTTQKLELALCLGEGDPDIAEQTLTKEKQDAFELKGFRDDAVERAILERLGWRVQRASEVASSPDDYKRYIHGSRGEFSCAKPSCMQFQNAWVSDRSICYMASGKPVIVQNTGPSQFLPDAEGMFRFDTVDDALSAIDAMNSDYKKHCSAARELAATYFDAEKVLASMLDIAI